MNWNNRMPPYLIIFIKENYKCRKICDIFEFFRGQFCIFSPEIVISSHVKHINQVCSKTCARLLKFFTSPLKKSFVNPYSGDASWSTKADIQSGKDVKLWPCWSNSSCACSRNFLSSSNRDMCSRPCSKRVHTFSTQILWFSISIGLGQSSFHWKWIWCALNVLWCIEHSKSFQSYWSMFDSK